MSFEFIRLLAGLRPKVFVAENFSEREAKQAWIGLDEDPDSQLRHLDRIPGTSEGFSWPSCSGCCPGPIQRRQSAQLIREIRAAPGGFTGINASHLTLIHSPDGILTPRLRNGSFLRL